MPTTRRDFLETGLRLGAGMSLLGSTPLGALASTAAAPPHPLRILILGGTAFIGPHLIAYAQSRGHAVTTFTRGRTEPTVERAAVRQAESLIGDRAEDLSALRGRQWDAVIDNSGRQVEWTRASAELLRDSVGRYVYTSSTGVYYPYLGSDIGEDTELVLEVPEGLNDDESLEYGYGVMKAQSEIAARTVFGPERTLVVRPTYIMGPGDRTNRFVYWPERLSRGGEILVPGRRDDPVQYVDVRDLAGWMIRLIENEANGTLNAVGPASTTGMMAFIHGAHAAFSSPADFVVVDDYDFLSENRVGFAVPWIMPRGDNFGSARVNRDAAMANGLTLTPLAQSVRDVHDWWHSDAVPQDRRENLSGGTRSLMAREADILAAWKRA